MSTHNPTQFIWRCLQDENMQDEKKLLYHVMLGTKSNDQCTMKDEWMDDKRLVNSCLSGSTSRANHGD